jgi:predicted transporter
LLLKSLVLGILFGIGIFAVKSGLGVAVALYRRRRRERLLGLVAFAGVWAAVFSAVALVLPRLDPLRHLAAIQSFMRAGMLIHLVMAGLMAVWGVVLLRRSESPARGSRGWLLLVLPCPVCVTVIFLSAAFFLARFPEHGALLVPGLYLAFMGIALAAAALAGRRPRGRPEGGAPAAVAPESFLGGAMLLLAVYFFLSVTIMPQFADLDKVYRLAGPHGDARAAVANPSRLVPVLAAVTAFAAGFGTTWKRARRQS